MSGGYLEYQKKKGEHQTVTFIFAGPLDAADVDEWNKRILALKERFGNQVMGVTVKASTTPNRLRPKRRR